MSRAAMFPPFSWQCYGRVAGNPEKLPDGRLRLRLDPWGGGGFPLEGCLVPPMLAQQASVQLGKGDFCIVCGRIEWKEGYPPVLWALDWRVVRCARASVGDPSKDYDRILGFSKRAIKAAKDYEW